MRERHHHHHHYHSRDRDRESYAYQAGQPGPGPNFHRLRRNTRRGKVAGVCAGLSDYFGWKLKWVRFGFIIATVVPPFFPFGAIVYGLMAVLVKPQDDTALAPLRSEEEERFWRKFSTAPKATFAELKHRFRALDARIADMEHAVTSDEYGLRKAFRDLERGA